MNELTDDDEIGDASVDQVLGGLESSLSLPELETPCGADNGAAQVDDAGHWWPVSLDDVVAAIDHALEKVKKIETHPHSERTSLSMAMSPS